MVAEFVLATDTGASNSDHSTSNASLSGTVTGSIQSESTTLEIDSDGDGEADSTEWIGYEGSFSLSLYELPTGLNTISMFGPPARRAAKPATANSDLAQLRLFD